MFLRDLDEIIPTNENGKDFSFCQSVSCLSQVYYMWLYFNFHVLFKILPPDIDNLQDSQLQDSGQDLFECSNDQGLNTPPHHNEDPQPSENLANSELKNKTCKPAIYTFSQKCYFVKSLFSFFPFFLDSEWGSLGNDWSSVYEEQPFTENSGAAREDPWGDLPDDQLFEAAQQTESIIKCERSLLIKRAFKILDDIVDCQLNMIRLTSQLTDFFNELRE